MKKTYAFSSLVLVATAGLWWALAGMGPGASPDPVRPSTGEAVELPPAPASTAAATGIADAEVMTVYKSPACGCCDGWIEHLRAHGFEVAVEETADVGAVKRQLGVARNLTSCHTGVIAGKVVEGHVPADAIRRFLSASGSSDALGLAVPGMPVGSPGMEVQGRPAMSYDILAFHADGRSEVFERR